MSASPIRRSSYHGNAIVYTDGSSYYSHNRKTGILTSGTSFATILQGALDGLTAGRTTKEKVVVMGNMTQTSNVNVPSYAILDLSTASITRFGNNYHLFSCTSQSDVEIYGGIINSAAKLAEEYNTNEIHFDGVTKFLIDNVTINNAAEDAIAVKGASANGRITRNMITNPHLHSIDITGSTVNNITVANNVISGTEVYDAITVYVNGGHTIAITGNTIKGINGSAVSSSAIHVEDITPTNLNNIAINGNSIYDCKYGITTAAARPVSINGNVIRKTTRGIQLVNPIWTSVSGNVVDNSEQVGTAYCVYVYGITASTIANNVFRGPASSSLTYGIYWDESGTFAENSITGNAFARTYYGMRYTGSRNIISDSVFRYGQRTAILVQDGASDINIADNVFYNNGQATTNTYHDIDIEATAGAPTSRIDFANNKSRSDTTNKIAYHINFQSGANTTSVFCTGLRATGMATGVINGTPASDYLLRSNPSIADN